MGDVWFKSPYLTYTTTIYPSIHPFSSVNKYGIFIVQGIVGNAKIIMEMDLLFRIPMKRHQTCGSEERKVAFSWDNETEKIYL